ncbi:MAG: FtsX-like permease family protein [Pseudohongiellaceae bacterium]
MLIRSVLATSLRQLYREKVYAGINIAGLSLGFACCVSMALYLATVLSYDRHFADAENIYRVAGERNVNGVSSHVAPISPLIGSFLSRQMPQVREVVRFTRARGSLFESASQSAYWDRVYTVDPTVFSMFSHRVLFGNPDAALAEPGSIAVSESFARHHFGAADAVGRVVEHEGMDQTITLVFADQPATTHLKYDVLLYRNPTEPDSPAGDRRLLAEMMFATSDYTYIKLPARYDTADFDQVSETLWETQLEPQFGTMGIRLSYYLEPLTDIHLDSITEQDQPRASSGYVLAFISIALFVLLVACINYVNLATARALGRAKEVGMRKVIGAGRGQLIRQFLGESFCVTVASFALGLVLADLLLRQTTFTNLLGADLEAGMIVAPWFLLAMSGLALLVTVFAGLYPAFYLSGFSPLAILNTTRKTGRRAVLIRQGLVFAQFMITVAVISIALLMYLQMDFVRNKPLGFESDNRVTMRVFAADIIDQLPAFINTLKQHPNILNATISQRLPGDPLDIAEMQIEDNEGMMQLQQFNRIIADSQYLDTLGIELIAGRGYDAGAEYEIERMNTLVNETLARQMGWEQPLGKRVASREVIGVVRDFHFHDLHEAIGPLEMRLDLPYFDLLSPERRRLVSRALTISLGGGSLSDTLDFIRTRWNEFDPAHPFAYRLLGDNLNQLYVDDNKQMRLLAWFAGLFVMISCMGLFGLSAYNTEQRGHELGIRKVLGATPGQLLMLLFKNVCVVVLSASVLSWLFSYLLINRWLESFAYRADIDYLVFVLASGFCLAIAFVTIALQAWKTATQNPVSVLRYE